jgi:ornithine cyclodeaminase
MGEIVAERKAGRERDEETILFWHRGLALSDIALGSAMLERRRGSASVSACAMLERKCRR